MRNNGGGEYLCIGGVSSCGSVENDSSGADWVLFTNYILSQSNYISISCVPCGLVAVRTVQIPQDSLCFNMHACINTYTDKFIL